MVITHLNHPGKRNSESYSFFRANLRRFVAHSHAFARIDNHLVGHRLKIVLEILFYPDLSNPIIEREIHDGRKRIDIVMDNNAQNGFFNQLHSIAKIYCPYVYIECKNYGKDVSNPEIDQLSSRFSPQRGQFGLLICREIKDEQTFRNRCIDTYKDHRGLVLYLTDNDIVQMLLYAKEDNRDGILALLEEKKREVMVS